MPRRSFADLDYFCQAYKMIFARSTGPLREELRRMYGKEMAAPALYAISPY